MSSVLSERVRPLNALQDLFEECLAGNSRVAVVSGPVGCGKTELLNEFAAHVDANGADYLGATASRVEQAVPFGLLAHLLHTTQIPSGPRARAMRWVAEAQSVLTTRFLQGGRTDDVAPQTFHGMCMALLDIVEQARRPLVIGIDDAHSGDTPSLRCLSYVVRRLRSQKLLVVLNESPHSRRIATLSEAELPPEPQVRFVRLPLLSPQGVEDVMAEQLGRAQAQRLAADGYAVTGGNPLLLRGLVKDNRSTVESQSSHFRVADGFSQALISCVFRYEPEVLQVARHLAVLEEAPSVAVLAQLAGLDAETSAQALDILRETGILSGGLLRHAQARSAVLSGMTPEERADLQTHTANVMFKNGFSAITIARQILGADRVDTDCAIPVLHEAAEAALAEGEVEFALDCLRVALQYDTDERRQAVTTAMIVRATWRTDPYAAYRRVGGLAADSRAGRLSGRHVTAPVDALMWFGRPDEAIEILQSGAEEALATHDLVTSSHLEASCAWLNVVYPERSVEWPGREAEETTATGGVSPEAWTKRRAAAMFRRNLTAGPDAASVGEAQQALRHYALNEGTAALLLTSVHTLIHAERLQEARQWAEGFISQARRDSAVVWEALFCAAHAEIRLRQGDPRAAVQQVEQALALLPARSWGVMLGLPVSTALHASALTGSTSPAVDEAQSSIPQAIFETPLGMRLLRARGHKYLADGQVSAALDDFLAAGELAGRWGIDNPVAVPWRSSAAEALIRLGHHERARLLLTEQVRMCGPAHPRVYAGTLRKLAAVSSLDERLKLLTKAAECLQTCEAPLELAFALHDLGWVQQELGQYSKGRLMLRRARLMAEQSGVRIPSPAPLATDTDEEAARDARPATQNGPLMEALSDAEMRVAQLAVGGLSNRQIAGRLFVTVSTVEQHLTRIYRKLNIKRRTELVGALQAAGRQEHGGSFR
ncbi:AAA family ATPase [Streptomyces sp. NPDC058255]|uniref:helix-turn-helix transcriptional regulator n=1 Tax=Streptomyces sp. NPDC058255 TaxID=3346407 RepID=UPI0036F02994